MGRVLIIAEAGVNHNGDIDIAKKLIEKAAWAKADIVKFQTFNTDAVLLRDTKQAEYQKQNCGNQTQYEMVKKYELSPEAHLILIDHAQKYNIEFLSTAFDFGSVDLLHKLQLKRWKIPSGEITNIPYLRKIGQYNEEIILSTGMPNLGEIERAILELVNAGTSREKINLLHCTTEYPAPFAEINLKAIQTLQTAFQLNTGYSDHTKGIEAAIAAVALGATIIEKHFTLDNTMEGPDHKASLEPKDLKKMVEAIRNIELGLGNGIKVSGKTETKNIALVRKIIVAAQKIAKNEVYSPDNLTVKRGSAGIGSEYWDLVCGKKAGKNYEINQSVEI